MIRRDTENSGSNALRFLDDYAKSKGLAFTDEALPEEIMKTMAAEWRQHRDDPIRIYGSHTQSMFAYVAAALGKCEVITEEDAGMFFDRSGELGRPDFRIVTVSGDRFLVEVKNFRPKKNLTPIIFKADYLKKMSRYAEIVGLPLKFAIYWSKWRRWTLIDAKPFTDSNGRASVHFSDAMKLNEMSLIGEAHLGTVPPLVLRLHADPTKPQALDSSGKVNFTIGRVSLFSGGQELTEEVAKTIAFSLMMYGQWTGYKQTPNTSGGKLESLDQSVFPEETTDDQGFEIIGTTAQIASAKYMAATTNERRIKALAPSYDLSLLATRIPEHYNGQLPLWIFHQVPPGA